MELRRELLRRSNAKCSVYPSLQGYRDRRVEKSERALPCLLLHFGESLWPAPKKQVRSECLDVVRFVSPGRSDGCSDGVQGSILRGNDGTDGNSECQRGTRPHTPPPEMAKRSRGNRTEPLRQEAPGYCSSAV